MRSSCVFTDSTPSWEDYFKLSTGGLGKHYQYNDTSVTELPDDLPQPPNDYPVSFNGCHHLVNIDALAKWNTSKMTNTAGMFNHCRSLEDISPLRPWILSNVTDMRYMFNCCYMLRDVSAIKMWDVSKVTRMRFIFNGCHELPDFARLEVYDQQTFNCFIERYLMPPIVDYYPTYNTDNEVIEIEEEEEENPEEWDGETMTSHPFPEAYNESTQTMNQLNGISNECSDNDDLTVTTTSIHNADYYIPAPSNDSSDDSLTMTLTPEMMRKCLISSSEEDEPY